MRDRLRRSALPSHLHVLRVLQELLRQLHDFRRHRRREEQRLPLGGKRREDALHVGPEAHVEHPVRFVEHEHLERAEAHRGVPHVIHQAAGRGDDDVDVRLERLLLLGHLDAAEDGDARHGRVIREALHLIFDLHGELSRGRENQRTRGRPPRRTLTQKSLKNRNEERGGLAGAGFSGCNHVVTRERERNHTALDRPRFGPAELLDPLQQPRIETQLVERDRRRVERLGLVRNRRRLGLVVNRLLMTAAPGPGRGRLRAGTATSATPG